MCLGLNSLFLLQIWSPSGLAGGTPVTWMIFLTSCHGTLLAGHQNYLSILDSIFSPSPSLHTLIISYLDQYDSDLSTVPWLVFSLSDPLLWPREGTWEDESDWSDPSWKIFGGSLLTQDQV